MTRRNATRLAEARHEAGITQGDLASELGVTQATVSRWEAGDRVPERHRPVIAKVLGVEADDLWAPKLAPVVRVPDGATASFLSPAEAADRLGVSRRFIYNLTAQSVLPSTRLGSRVLIPVEAIEALRAEALGGAS